MHRFYIAPNEWNPNAPTLTGAEAHHARDVLRLERGQKIVVFNGQGREVTGEIIDCARDEIQLRPVHQADTPSLPCRITLGQAIPKGKNMELIVQKAVELGAAEIAPLISDRTIIRLGPEDAAARREKWQGVAIEAAKQCGQNWLPEVHTPRPVAEFLAAVPAIPVAEIHDRRAAAPELRLIGSLQGDALPLKKILAEFERDHGQRPARVLMLIGPEGDFTPAELALARTHSCRPITLGPIILRVETAALYCLSVLSYELLA